MLSPGGEHRPSPRWVSHSNRLDRRSVCPLTLATGQVYRCSARRSLDPDPVDGAPVTIAGTAGQDERDNAG